MSKRLPKGTRSGGSRKKRLVDPKTRDPLSVDRPAPDFIDKGLREAWSINKTLPIAFIFDTHYPVRQFKKDMRYDDNRRFPSYVEPYDDLTESDTDGPGLMPFLPRKYECVCRFLDVSDL